MINSGTTGSNSSTYGTDATPDPARELHPAQVSSGEIRRLPRQARAHETVTAILQAGAEIIAAEGFGRASTNRIATRAGVSIGSLYQYFPNKEAIRQQLVSQHHEEVDRIIERSMIRLEDPDIPFADALRSLFEELVAMHQVDPALIRALSDGTPAVECSSERREPCVRPFVQ